MVYTQGPRFFLVLTFRYVFYAIAQVKSPCKSKDCNIYFSVGKRNAILDTTTLLKAKDIPE
jgi:hypothetical protein